MISICVPIYNFKVLDLVRALTIQVNEIRVPVEIILIDDASNHSFKEENQQVCSMHKYIKLENNIGRSAIRNHFLKYAQHEHLLFLDCDSLIVRQDFLSRYIDEIQEGSVQLICGGREQQEKQPPRNQVLRWKYGKVKESLTAEKRQRQPHRSFMTNNYLIHRKIFENIQFNETLTQYGHEDTMLGFELKKKNICIKHINNPVLNGHLESNQKFLNQTEQAISNLIQLVDITKFDKDFIYDVSLLRVYYKLYRFRKINKALFCLFNPLLRFILIQGIACIPLFDLYKLGHLTSLMKIK